jgi:sugar phosphate permease
MTALVLGATVANRWFVERRGLVIGIMTASSATGQLLFLPGYAAIDAALGWRAVLYAVSAAMFLLVPLILWLMRDKPADIGLRAYGEPFQDTTPAAATTAPFLWNSSLQNMTDWAGFVLNGNYLFALSRNAGQALASCSPC